MLKYLCDPQVSNDDAQALAEQQGYTRAIPIMRRGTPLAFVVNEAEAKDLDTAEMSQRWQAAQGVFLPGFYRDEIQQHHTAIQNSLNLMNGILDDQDAGELLEAEDYVSRLAPKFELLPACYNESDTQEITKIDADVYDGEELIAEDLWLKFSWLSFEDDDLSLRCRVSFGQEGFEDVAASWDKQQLAADLTEAVFPESALISESTATQKLLSTLMGVDKVAYVERIIYFNAPNGGAQFHQDVERGHAGVVFAQLHGATAWIALSKSELMDEAISFYGSDAGKAFLAAGEWDAKELAEFETALVNRPQFAEMFECRDNNVWEYALNRSPGSKALSIVPGIRFSVPMTMPVMHCRLPSVKRLLNNYLLLWEAALLASQARI
jgi:hypothetical protein